MSFTVMKRQHKVLYCYGEVGQGTVRCCTNIMSSGLGGSFCQNITIDDSLLGGSNTKNMTI